MSDENIKEKTISLLQFQTYCDQKVMKLRFKNGEGVPETYEGWLEQCKKYLTEEEFKRYVSKGD